MPGLQTIWREWHGLEVGKGKWFMGYKKKRGAINICPPMIENNVDKSSATVLPFSVFALLLRPQVRQFRFQGALLLRVQG